jgi:hypothetical protein
VKLVRFLTPCGAHGIEGRSQYQRPWMLFLFCLAPTWTRGYAVVPSPADRQEDLRPRVLECEGATQRLPCDAMQGDQHPAKVALREAREATIDQLSEGFARDELSLTEFEQRVDRAYAATSTEEAQSLVNDLSVGARAQLRVAPNPDVQPAGAGVSAPQQTSLARSNEDWLAFAIFGNVERHGRYAVEPGSRALAVFGNVELDLRAVNFPKGITAIHVEAIFGNVEIILPPTIFVECHGVSIFGNYASLGRVPIDDEGGAVLRITGKAVFGNVELSTIPSQFERHGSRAARLGK